MLNYQTQCKRIKNTFDVVIDENPLAATLMLGNLFCSLKLAPDEALLINTVAELKAKLTIKHIQVLFSTATTLPSYRLKLMSQTNLLALDQFKHQMVQNVDFFKHLSMDSLITLGQDMSFYREVFVALIRKHLDEKKQLDPFNNPEFSYDLLSSAAPEQNFSYISKFIKMCPTVPLEKLVLLGAYNNEIAALILLDIKQTQVFFEISSCFAQLHETLHKEIAIEWQRHIESMPLTVEEQRFTQENLPTLKQIFPEFKAIDIENRVKRNNHINPFVNKYKPLMKVLTGVNLASLGTSIGIPYALAQVGFVMTIPPLALTLPVCYAGGFGMYYLFKNPEEIKIDNSEMSPHHAKRRRTI